MIITLEEKKYFLTIIKNILNIKDKNKIYNLETFAKFSNPGANNYKKIVSTIARNIETI